MTSRNEHRPLRACPPDTLAALKAHVTALLRYEALLPADLYVKLDLLRGDVAAILAPAGTPRPPASTPHAAGPSRGLPDRR